MRPSMTASVARRRPGTGLLYLITSGLLWGTGGLTGSLLSRVAGLSAMSVAACRLTAGGVLILAFLTVTGRRWPAGRAAWTRIAVIGVLAALYQSCYFTAVALTSVALATLVTIGTAPVIVLVVYRVTGRRAGRLAPVAACLALAGLGLLVGLPSGFSEATVLASAGMAVLAAAGFAALTLTGARPVPGLDDLTVTGFGFALGGLILMPLAAALGGLSFRPSPEAVGLLIALGIGPTAVAYTLYFRGLRRAAASTAALLTLLEPLTGAVLAALVLGQRLSATGIAGAAILVAAVLVTVLGADGARDGEAGEEDRRRYSGARAASSSRSRPALSPAPRGRSRPCSRSHASTSSSRSRRGRCRSPAARAAAPLRAEKPSQPGSDTHMGRDSGPIH